MHGLMGGGWKRKRPDQGREEEQRNGKLLHSLWLHDLPSGFATAPVPDPPPDVIAHLVCAAGACGGDTEAPWRGYQDAWYCHGGR